MQPTEVYLPQLEPSASTPSDGKIGLDKPARSQESTQIDMPLDIILSLLRLDELAKLQKYIASYLGKH